MKQTKLNIFQYSLNLLTSKLGVVMVVLLFVVTPILGMSFSMITSTSQLIEEEHSHNDSDEDYEENSLKLLSCSLNKILFIYKIVILKKTPIKVACKNTLSFDVFLPPPKQV